MKQLICMLLCNKIVSWILDLPWNTMGAKTILSSVLRKGGSSELQAEACVACISSCSRDLDISDGCVDIRSFSVDVFTDKLVEGVGALNTLWGRVKSRRSVNTVLHGKYCLSVFRQKSLFEYETHNLKKNRGKLKVILKPSIGCWGTSIVSIDFQVLNIRM